VLEAVLTGFGSRADSRGEPQPAVLDAAGRGY
jgi:hypothetical protein